MPVEEDTPRSSKAAPATSRETPRGPSTAAVAAIGDHPHGRLHLLVISDRLVATYPLPDSGEISIGRAPTADVSIDEDSISRTHAIIAVGPPLTIRDLSSVNGTRVRDKTLEPGRAVEIQPGEVVQLGMATLIVQRRSAPMRPRRLWAHDYFEVRLEEECARATRMSSPFALIRIRCEPPTRSEAVQETLADLVRLSDVVGAYGPNEYELLLVDTEPEEAEQALKRFDAELKRRGLVVRTGMACFPRDGRSPDELMARAGVRSPGGGPTGERAVVVADKTMKDLYRLAERIASGTISVLILGETGVGKEVLAEKVHRLSPRAPKPYLRLNCAALSETLLESELFGHERGAFTGAVAAKPGLLETADGGTVFLDEVGELPTATQVKLLRVIEDRMVLRVGAIKARPIDVRFVAATNRDLESEVAAGRFRQDLFFRLNGATLVIPPLRERPTEIGDLAQAFLQSAARQTGRGYEPALSYEALEVLKGYSWPGNIRELRNVVERAVLLCGPGPILPKHLPLEKIRVTFAAHPAPGPPAGAPTSAPLRAPLPLPSSSPTPTPPPLDDGDPEKQRILDALNRCAGNQTAAAKLLGMGRRTLINRLDQYGIARPRKGR